MLWIIIILAFIILHLFILLFSIKKGIRLISQQLKDIVDFETDKNINIPLFNSELSALATEINHTIDAQRKLSSHVYQQEKKLKDSIAYITHDLRTPLTSIMGYLQLLKKSQLSEEQLYNVNIALQKSETLKELISSFFELSRFESKRNQLDFEKVNVSNIISDSIIENMANFNRIDIRPEISICQEPAFILGDPLLLKRIMENLLSNAIKYTAGDIWIELKQGIDVELVIKNSIHHSTDINLDTLFNKFHTGDQSRNQGATGLGLPIVKILVAQMNGHVSTTIIQDRLDISIKFPLHPFPTNSPYII